MRKILFALAMLVSLIFIGVCANADTVDKDKGYISVSQSATKEISPNQAEISFGIETSDISIQKASEDNKKLANKVYASLKSTLSTEDSIKTNNYSVYPQYIYTKDSKKILDKYVVSNTVIVKTKKINLVSKLIDTATTQGATSVAGLRFLADDCDDSCDDLLAELTKKAYNKANTVAKSINSQITGIKSINISCNSENNQIPRYGMMKANMDSASAVSTPIESGKLKIYATVDASFYVK
jgi:uncharacterized protein YggE